MSVGSTQWKIYSVVGMQNTSGRRLKSVIRNTAWINGRRNDMLKIRLQGTKKDINWFKKVIMQNDEIEILQFSEPYANKGTTNYFRVYGEVEKNDK